MKNRKRKIAGVATIFMILCLGVWLKPQDMYSAAERRPLAQLPKLQLEAIWQGRYMEDFESYTVDQFPLREMFRRIKAIVSLKRDNNGLYLADGHLNDLEYPLQEESLARASKVFQNICTKYLKENKVYLSIIPDKNYFFAKKNGYLALDYKKLVADMKEQNANMQYIDIFPLLSGEDYYQTDVHWKQEKLLPVANKILDAMCLKEAFFEGEITDNYVEKQVDGDFYGVYYGQAALPIKPDSIHYLTNSTIAEYKVYDHEHGRKIPVYDLEKSKGEDPYAMFLGGSVSLVTIENEAAMTDRELIIFRDSFGSSIAPVLAEQYKKTTLIDIRYIQSGILDKYVDFEKADILFLYSVPVLNNSDVLK